jgi:carboxyl-terminal processing protease
MMPASNKGLGMNFCFPDLLLSLPPIPPLPIPWPNLGFNALAVPFSPNIFVGFMPALTMASIIPLTMGDQGGFASGRIMLPGCFTMGNPTIYVNCVPAVNLLAPATGNAMNAFLGAAIVPSITTTFFTDRAADVAVEPELTLEGLRWLDGEVAANRDAVMVERHDDVQLVRVDRFVRTTANVVAEAMAADGIVGTVLDLRGCPGGDVRAALELADDLLPEGAVLARRLEAGDDEEDATPLVARSRTYDDRALVVLIDERTASAAEVLASALQFHGRARVLGTRSAGKATVQTVVPADARRSSYTSVAELRRPDGCRLHGIGIEPDGPTPERLDGLFAAQR